MENIVIDGRVYTRIGRNDLYCDTLEDRVKAAGCAEFRAARELAGGAGSVVEYTLDGEPRVAYCRAVVSGEDCYSELSMVFAGRVDALEAASYEAYVDLFNRLYRGEN